MDQVLIVDDSIVFRKNLEKVLSGISNVIVIDSVWNGKLVLPYLSKENKPDLITLDVEMPEMDGLETLKHIQDFNSSLPPEEKIQVLMVSSKTTSGSDITINALGMGAYDFILKPSLPDPEENLRALRLELEKKLQLYKIISKEKPENSVAASVFTPQNKRHTGKFSLITIGISTGGPKSLITLLPKLSEVTDLPIVVVQHMPEGFTPSLVKLLDKICKSTVVEGNDNMEIVSAYIYIAPGGRNLLVKKEGNRNLLFTNNNPVANNYSPSVDLMFRSASSVYGEELISVVMTGMGNDGTAGIGMVKRRGGLVLAQDEASSVVWGMPKRAIESGNVDKILSLDKIADYVGSVSGAQ